jgi:hypothetical protein
MTWLDSLTLASRSLRRRPGRALLTILAVTLGATLLVALASVATSAGSRIVSKLTNGGPATAIKVAASKADSDQAYTDDLRAAGPKPITDATLNTVRQSSHVATVIPVIAARILAVPPPFGSAATPSSGISAYGDTMVGVDLSQAHNLPITILAGRLPHPGSLNEDPGRDRRAPGVPGSERGPVPRPLDPNGDRGRGLTAGRWWRLPGVDRAGAARAGVGARGR